MPNTHSLSELSVFFPCYNEESNLQATFDKTLPILSEITKRWEIIIINDGSKDKTGQIAESIKAKYPHNVKVVTHDPNRGYGAAVKSGLYTAQYEWIAFTDSDGQFDFSEIKNFIQLQKETNSDLVIGYYLSRQVSSFVKLTSKIWELIVYILFGLHVTDIDCGFKLINKKVINSIPKLEAERGAFITSELLIKAKKAGFKISEVGVHHYPRTAGEATGRNIKVIIKSFSDLFKLWLNLNFASK